jgi:Arc/MetJ family transcription regulator
MYYLYAFKIGIHMRTTFDLDDELIREVMQVSRAKTKKGAIVVALQEYLRARRRQELKDLIGAYDEFDLTLEELEKMRREE